MKAVFFFIMCQLICHWTREQVYVDKTAAVKHTTFFLQDVTVCIWLDLVGGLEHEIYVSIQLGNFIIPTDELADFSGVSRTKQVFR